MKDKGKKSSAWALSVVISLFIGMGAVMKLVGLPQIEEIYLKIGMLQYLKILGCTELLLVALFLWSRSMKIGFLLLTGYFGGAMAVEISHGTLFILPGTILTLVWIAAYLRDASIFHSAKNEVIEPITAVQ